MSIKDPKHGGGILGGCRNLRINSQLAGSMEQYEQRPQRQAQTDQLPIQPTIDIGAFASVEICGKEPALRIAGGQIPQDCIGFPQHEVVILEGRDQSVGILGSIRWIVGSAKGSANIDALVGEPKFIACP